MVLEESGELVRGDPGEKVVGGETVVLDWSLVRGDRQSSYKTSQPGEMRFRGRGNRGGKAGRVQVGV